MFHFVYNPNKYFGNKEGFFVILLNYEYIRKYPLFRLTPFLPLIFTSYRYDFRKKTTGFSKIENPFVLNISLFDDDVIQEVTGLSKEELKKLMKELQ
ncbi:hypothetical protein DCC39_05305 [Pueribacillus theae]|uniref:Uncharacterized protein n=1 Tax=Pueribacillus theae TaxID=2171751 RepID=A0A2U1K563_9BACI|nr:hypothetical protein DCC39_05305 [Pueribacillus theae]